MRMKIFFIVFVVQPPTCDFIINFQYHMYELSSFVLKLDLILLNLVHTLISNAYSCVLCFFNIITLVE